MYFVFYEICYKVYTGTYVIRKLYSFPKIIICKIELSLT